MRELPPLVRGRERIDRPGALCGGITPARAGKRYRLIDAGQRLGNYPRSCGEERRQFVNSVLMRELPPLVRGRDPETFERTPLDGITPARAGKSYFFAHVLALPRNYPRSCGEERSGRE